MDLESDDLPTTLSVSEAAKLLGIGRTRAFESVKSGEIPSIRFGSCVRVPTAEILRMLGSPCPSRDENVKRSVARKLGEIELDREKRKQALIADSQTRKEKALATIRARRREHEPARDGVITRPPPLEPL